VLKTATYELRVQASPSAIQSWDSLDVRQSLSRWTASADSSGTGTLLARADRPLTGSRLAFTTSSSGSNKIWIISGAFGLWIIPFKHAYTYKQRTVKWLWKNAFLSILTNCTAHSMIGYWHDNVVCCPSVCLWWCALWLNDTFYSKIFIIYTLHSGTKY